MSGKLDQSLDEIMKDSKTTGGAKRGRGRVQTRKAAIKSKAATTAAIAPSGGIQKNKKAATKQPPRGPAAAAPGAGTSKIQVSNLPEDVTEALIKEYFSSSVGPVKYANINYGPNGRSRGIATVVFNDPTAAAKAVGLDGLRVDQKPMKIEVLLGAKSVPGIAQSKSLAERMSKPKNAAKEKPKQAPGAKGAANGATNGANKDGRAAKKKSGRAGKPKPKTADELDAEMQDYFGGGETNGAPTNGAVEPVAATDGGDTGMVDEVL